MLSWSLRYLAVAIVVAAASPCCRAAAGSSGRPRRAPRAEHSADRRRAPARGRCLEYVVEAGPHGHFVLDAVVNGVPITFLVDTGASDDRAQPRRMRGRWASLARHLDFSRRFRTANGVVRAAPVSLRELRIGQFSLYDLEAAVNEAPIGISLLGMGFLERLAGYEVADGRLILRW